MYDTKTFEDKKYGLLSVIFGLIIGTYWLFRPIKDAVFLTMVGKLYQPKAKILSLFVVGIMVLIYSKLVDKYPRHKLLYGISLFYALATAVFAFLIWHPSLGLSNIVTSPDRVLGWVWYVFVESFGSIMVALFWSFVSDSTSPEVAKRRYFSIAIGGQLGGFMSPLVAQQVTDKFGTGITLLIPVFLLFCLLGLITYYMRTIAPHDAKQDHGYDARKTPLEGRPKKTGFFEGARLLVTRPYLLGIFTIVAFYEIVVTILDYHFKVLASTQYTGDALTNYLYGYALWTNGIALLCLMFGVGAIGRRLGLTRTLLLLPILVACAVVTFNVHPVLQIAFFIMVSCKGLNYALIQPSKEQLYIPTSKESKYKAKAWIDMFGSRSSKGMGAAINNCKEMLGSEMFMMTTAALSMGLIGLWVIAAILVGRIHRKAVDENRLVC
jgi:AAA family ATP:ADP antiporter